MSGFTEKLNVETAEIQRGNCVHYICTKCLDLLKKFNIQNSKNSTGNCIHYISTEWVDLQKNRMSRIAKIQREIMYIICTECLDL